MSRTLPTVIIKPMSAPETSSATIDANEGADKASTPGGALGVLPEIKAIHMPGVPSGSAVRPRDASIPEVPARTHRVMNQWPVSVMYDNSQVRFAPGKVVSDAQYDLDLLRRQGVILEELKS